MEIQNPAAKEMDRMSGLPDEILLHILSFLPTKNVVSTSILSSRYCNLWTELPVIDLVENNDHYCVKSDKNKFAFVNFLNNLLLVNTSSTIRKFRLKQNFDFDERYLSRINGWIRFVLSKNVVELDLETRLDNEDDFCLRFWPCDSLEILKLSTNTGLLIPLISGGCFRNLRIFHFSFDENPPCRELVTKLFPNLPLLEELMIRVETYGKICFNIVAPALKTFSINRVDMATDRDEMEVQVVIDAPLLQHIRVEDDDVSFYSLNNCPLISEAKVNVGGMMDADNFLEEDRDPSTYISNLVKLLSGIANTKSLSLSGVTVLALACSQSNLPLFPRLTKLDLSIPYAPECKLLLPWLVNAPNLEVLTVAMREFKPTNEDIYASQESDLVDLIGDLEFCPPEVVPTCLLLHLKEIEARGFKKKQEMKILAYIVWNAKVLKKLTVNGVRRI